MTQDNQRSRNKALKLAYKLTFPAMGVYAIRHRGSGRTYLDKSTNLTGALNRHRLELKLGTHRNPALQRDWCELGEDQFSFEILEQITERADPAFDYAAELERCLAAWRVSLPSGTPETYN